MRANRRSVLLVSAFIAGSLASGCARLAPRSAFVRPHQRAHLADRIMQVDAHRLSRATDEHVLTTREGALGGGGAVSGGCGCN